MRRSWPVLALVPCLLLACSTPALGGTDDRAGDGAESSSERGRTARSRSTTPAGSTCRGRDDCATDQTCVHGACRHEESSVAAEILAAGAAAQLEAGDVSGALRSFEEAIAITERAGVNLPPETACGAARAALRNPSDADARERAARHADRCFRNSLPGDPRRLEVQRGLARHRYDGLDLAAFDSEEPPAAFFTGDPSRPTADAIQVTIELPDSQRPGFARLAEVLERDATKAAVSDCFVSDWDVRHERWANAALLLSYQSVLRDMGSYDLFEPRAQVRQTSVDDGGFEACLAQSLTAALEPGPRLTHSIAVWQVPFTVRARTR